MRIVFGEKGNNGEDLSLVRVRSEGDANWGWPSHLVFTLKNENGEEIEATVRVEAWGKPATGQKYVP